MAASAGLLGTSLVSHKNLSPLGFGHSIPSSKVMCLPEEYSQNPSPGEEPGLGPPLPELVSVCCFLLWCLFVSCLRVPF